MLPASHLVRSAEDRVRQLEIRERELATELVQAKVALVGIAYRIR